MIYIDYMKSRLFGLIHNIKKITRADLLSLSAILIPILYSLIPDGLSSSSITAVTTIIATLVVYLCLYKTFPRWVTIVGLAWFSSSSYFLLISHNGVSLALPLVVLSAYCALYTFLPKSLIKSRLIFGVIYLLSIAGILQDGYRLQIFDNIKSTLLSIATNYSPAYPGFFRGSGLLDIITIIFAACGVISFVWPLGRESIKMMAVVTFITLPYLFGNNLIWFIAPIVYMMAIAGADSVIDRWLRLFPKNKLIRGAGYIGIIILLTISSSYQVFRTLYVRRHTPEIVSSYK
jgi:hypothetical protein